MFKNATPEKHNLLAYFYTDEPKKNNKSLIIVVFIMYFFIGKIIIDSNIWVRIFNFSI